MGYVQGWSQATQSELVWKVDNDFDALDVAIVTGVVDG